jgi:hypothetical protein
MTVHHDIIVRYVRACMFVFMGHLSVGTAWGTHQRFAYAYYAHMTHPRWCVMCARAQKSVFRHERKKKKLRILCARMKRNDEKNASPSSDTFYTPLFVGRFEIIPIIFTVHKSLLGRVWLSTGTSCRLIVRALRRTSCVLNTSKLLFDVSLTCTEQVLVYSSSSRYRNEYRVVLRVVSGHRFDRLSTIVCVFSFSCACVRTRIIHT